MIDEPYTQGATLFELPAARRAQAAHRLSHVHRRLIEPIEQGNDLSFQHTVFCQTCLPYRDPGDDVDMGTVEWHGSSEGAGW
jgi:hypothetical protein